MAFMCDAFLCKKCGELAVIETLIKNEYTKCSVCSSTRTKNDLNDPTSIPEIVVTFEKTLLRSLVESNSALGNGSKAAQEAEVDQECPKCQHPKMSFRTAQLRGLDEGQTIFYTCLNKECGHHYTLNS